MTSADVAEMIERVSNLNLNTNSASGEPIACNAFALNCAKKMVIQKYTIDIKALFESRGKIQEKEITKQTRDDFSNFRRQQLQSNLLHILVKKHPETFKNGADSLFTDNAKKAYSTDTVFTEDTVFELGPSDYKQFSDIAPATKIVIKFVPVAGTVSNSNDDELLEVANCALLHQFTKPGNHDSFIWRGSVVLTKPEIVQAREFARNGIQILPVISKSVKFLEAYNPENRNGVPCVIVEVGRRLFHMEMPLSEKLVQSKIALFGGDPRRVTVDECFRTPKVLDAVRNLEVLASHNKNRILVVKRISPNVTAQTYRFMHNGVEMSCAQYFQNTYGIRLKHPHWPIVMCQRESALPLELLSVAPYQVVRASQETASMRDFIIRNSALLPAEKFAVIADAVSYLKLPTLEKLCGLRLERSGFMDIQKTLKFDMPQIKYGNIAVPANPDGSWQSAFRAKIQVISGSAAKKPACIVNCEMSRDEATAFTENYRKIAANMGVQLAAFYLTKASTFDEYESFFAIAKQNKCDFVIAISDLEAQMHSVLKYFEIKHQIATQEILRESVAKFTTAPLTAANFVLKTNVKLGGLNHNVSGLVPYLDKVIADPNRLILGLQLMHPITVNHVRLQSVGWAANTFDQKQKYSGDFYIANAHENFMDYGKLVFKQIFNALSGLKVAPSFFDIYVSGMSEGLLFNDGTKMISLVQAVAEELNYKVVEVHVIAISKDHNECLVPMAQAKARHSAAGARAKDVNLKPGTIAESSIVSARRNEFYLASCPPQKGTSRVPKYTVIGATKKVTRGLQAFELQAYALCFLHQITMASTSIPTPIYLAQEYSKRGEKFMDVLKYDTKSEIQLPCMPKPSPRAPGEPRPELFGYSVELLAQLNASTYSNHLLSKIRAC